MNEFENENQPFAADSMPDSAAPAPQEQPELPHRPPVQNQPAAPTAPFAAPPVDAAAQPQQNHVQSAWQYTQPPAVQPPSAAPVSYSPIVPMPQHEKAAPGLKVFALILALAIVLTAACAGGYVAGRKVSEKSLYSTVDVDLTAKPADSDEMTAAQVYAAVNPSVVGIRVYNTAGDAYDATGVIYTADGYVITNDHVYAEVGAPSFKIYMADGTQYDADYVAGDTISDLAVLKIRDGKDLTPATLGDSAETVCGENVVTISCPTEASAASTITKGIVSQCNRRMRSTTTNYSMRVLQIDAPINSGSSGGALVNMYGQVIGITAFKMNPTSGYEGLCFAIPTVTVKRVVEQLIEGGKVTDRAKLGITYNELDSVTAEMNDYDAVGLYISTVATDSDLYGKVDEGDIITHVNGIEITTDDIVLDVVEGCKAGDSITLTIFSDGASTDYTVVLAANVGESSYKETIDADEDSASSFESDDDNNNTFDFPFGE